jgi:hypothetical protein
MSKDIWIVCDECGERRRGRMGWDDIEHEDLTGDWQKWDWRDGKDYCPACALLLPPRPTLEPPAPLTQVSVAYMAALDEYVRSHVPDAVGVLSEDRKTVTYKFERKDERDR